jgi:hypothetical protein
VGDRGRRAFLSYSHVDKLVVERLEKDLGELGWAVWCDRALSGGQRWWDGILQNVRQCDVFVFGMSQAALRSEACSRELDYALALGKPVLPVIVGEPVPEALLPPVLSETQRVDVRAGDTKGALALGRALMQLPLVPPLPQPLPAPPAAPVSYLSDLKARVEQQRLPADEQWRLLSELEERIAEPTDRPAALSLLGEFARRPDLMQGVAVAAERVVDGHRLGGDAPALAGAEPQHTPAHRRKSGLAVVAAALLVTVALVIVVFALRRKSGGTGLSEFCDRARSADASSDTAFTALFTPEADPAKVERFLTKAQSDEAAAANIAPPEIESAARAEKANLDAGIIILGHNNWELAGVMNELDALDDQEFVTADRKFSDYVGEHCGINWDEPSGFTDVSTAARGLAVQNSASLGAALTTKEAECIASSVAAKIDGDRLLALYARAGVLYTNEENLIFAAAIDACVDPAKMADGFGKLLFGDVSGITREQSTCLAQGILKTITLKVWLDLQATSATPEQIQQLKEIARSCDVDPRLVLPVVGG